MVSKNQKFLTKYLFWKSHVYVPSLLSRITMNDQVTRRRTFIMLSVITQLNDIFQSVPEYLFPFICNVAVVIYLISLLIALETSH